MTDSTGRVVPAWSSTRKKDGDPRPGALPHIAFDWSITTIQAATRTTPAASAGGAISCGDTALPASAPLSDPLQAGQNACRRIGLACGKKSSSQARLHR